MPRKFIDLLVICCTLASFTSSRALAIEVHVLSEQISSNNQLANTKMFEILKNTFETGIEASKAIAFLKVSFSSAQDIKYLDGLLKQHQIPETYLLKVKSVRFEKSSIEIISANGRKVTFFKTNGESLNINGKIIDTTKKYSAKAFLEQIQSILRASYVADGNRNILYHLVFPDAHAFLETLSMMLAYGCFSAILAGGVAGLVAITHGVISGTRGSHQHDVLNDAYRLAFRTSQNCEAERFLGKKPYARSESREQYEKMKSEVRAMGIEGENCEDFVSKKLFAYSKEGWHDPLTYTSGFCDLVRKYAACMEAYQNQHREKPGDNSTADRPGCFTDLAGGYTVSFEKCGNCKVDQSMSNLSDERLCAKVVGTNGRHEEPIVGQTMLECAQKTGPNTWQSYRRVNGGWNHDIGGLKITFDTHFAYLKGFWFEGIRGSLEKAKCSDYDTKKAPEKRVDSKIGKTLR